MPNRTAEGACVYRFRSLTGVARELILIGLAGGDSKALAERLMHIECRLSDTGLEVLPGLAVSRERETRHWLIWGSGR